MSVDAIPYTSGFVAYFVMLIAYMTFSLFFASRVFAFCLKRLIDFYLWTRYKMYFSATSIKVSLLGGKILFKDLVLANKDITFHCAEGFVSVAYWRWGSYVSGSTSKSENPSKMLLF